MIVEAVDEKTMKAMVITAPGSVECRTVPVPVPGRHQVRIRVEGCGVCASNLGPWHGLPWLEYPRAPGEGGHEGWGTVEAVGAEVHGVDVGDRVAFLGDRAWAERTVVDAEVLVPLPDALGGRPVPGEAFGSAMNVFRRSRIADGQRVAVVGIGFIGAILCRLASRAGAEVTAISRRDESLRLAERGGAAHTVKMDDHSRILGECDRISGGRGFERVIECVGAQWPLDLAAELVAERGVLVIAGYHQDGPRQVSMQSWNWRGIDVVNAHERDPRVVVDGMRAAIAELAEGGLDLSALVTHQYPLEALGRALDDTAGKPSGFVKAVVTP
jgi:threonine dehydrogenase-like Zn-dependent dehydrogenase